jgi:hypothetical protein
MGEDSAGVIDDIAKANVGERNVRERNVRESNVRDSNVPECKSGEAVTWARR